MQSVTRSPVVAQTGPAQFDTTVARWQRPHLVLGDDARNPVEDLEHPGAGRGRALGHSERDPERAHRPDQHQQVGVEGAELSERDAPVDDLPAADEEDRREPELWQEADERAVEGLDPVGDHRLLEHAADAVRETPLLPRLCGEGLDDAHARDVLLDVRRQLSDALLDLLDGRS